MRGQCVGAQEDAGARAFALAGWGVALRRGALRRPALTSPVPQPKSTRRGCDSHVACFISTAAVELPATFVPPPSCRKSSSYCSAHAS